MCRWTDETEWERTSGVFSLGPTKAAQGMKFSEYTCTCTCEFMLHFWESYTGVIGAFICITQTSSAT